MFLKDLCLNLLIPSMWPVVQSWLQTEFLLFSGSMVALCLLCLSERWCRVVERPLIFAGVYSLPYFFFTFSVSLGDARQILETLWARYFMSEPGATLIHHWSYLALKQYGDLGPQSAVAMSSRVAGVVYLWSVGVLSRLLLPQASVSARVVFRLGFVGSVVALLFFGYIENTPISVAMELVWMVVAVLYLSRPTRDRLLVSALVFALACFTHGRLCLYAPIFLGMYTLPSGTRRERIHRLILASMVYVVVLGALLEYVFLVDGGAIFGNPFGNALGGGNRQMLVSRDEFLNVCRLLGIGLTIIAGCGPFALFASLSVWKRSPANEVDTQVLMWAVSYSLCAILFMLLWEFDFGLLCDWDLVCTGCVPLVLLGSWQFSKRPGVRGITVAACAVMAVVSAAFATVVNGQPLPFASVAVRDAPLREGDCQTPGLTRFMYVDSQFSNSGSEAQEGVPVDSPVEDDLNALQEGARAVVYRGLFRAPSAGRYRFTFSGGDNVQVSVGGAVLYRRWSDPYDGLPHLMVGRNRLVDQEVVCQRPGWYPFEVRTLSLQRSDPFELYIESRGVPRHIASREDFCVR
jgi:hypothetical protein